jgi:hypothetical protein
MNTSERGVQRQYLAAAFAPVCPVNGHRKPGPYQERGVLTCTGSPS